MRTCRAKDDDVILAVVLFQGHNKERDTTPRGNAVSEGVEASARSSYKWHMWEKQKYVVKYVRRGYLDCLSRSTGTIMMSGNKSLVQITPPLAFQFQLTHQRAPKSTSSPSYRPNQENLGPFT